MWPFHKHKLIEHARTYTPPADGVQIKLGTMTVYRPELAAKLLEKATHGLTTVLFRCQDQTCTFTKTVEMYGKIMERDVLEKMYDNSQ